MCLVLPYVLPLALKASLWTSPTLSVLSQTILAKEDLRILEEPKEAKLQEQQNKICAGPFN